MMVDKMAMLEDLLELDAMSVMVTRLACDFVLYTYTLYIIQNFTACFVTQWGVGDENRNKWEIY